MIPSLSLGGSDTTSFCTRSKLSVNIRASSSNSNSHERAWEIGWRVFVSKTMAEEPTFKVVDRRPFNPDGTPRELSPEEKEAQQQAEAKAAAAEPRIETAASEKGAAPEMQAPPSEPAQARRATREETQPTGRDPLDDPASFISLVMSLASNAAASLGMMPHPVTGETGVDLKTAKHWIDVLGMLEKKTTGNLDAQEEQMVEGLLADLRMQYVSFTGSPQAPPAKFSATDITGGK